MRHIFVFRARSVTIMSASFHAFALDRRVVFASTSESMRRRMPAQEGFIGPSISLRTIAQKKRGRAMPWRQKQTGTHTEVNGERERECVSSRCLDARAIGVGGTHAYTSTRSPSPTYPPILQEFAIAGASA